MKPDAGPPPGQRARAADGHPEVEPADKVLYLTADAGRFFLVPAGHELAPGDLRVVSLTGEERLADPAALGAVEVSRDGAEAHLRALAQRSVSAAADVVGRALGLAGLGEALPDLPSIADRLGTREQRDPQAAKAALEALTADMHAISAALASGAGADLDAARERLARRGIDLGDTLDDLPGYVAAIRRLEQDSAAQVAARGLRAMADAIEGEPESLGRRIDELIARLEREVGPFLGADPQRRTRERQERYARSARSAIGDALRARGITPLATDEPHEPPPTDEQPATDAPRDEPERKPS